MRSILLYLHRYLGLAMALFLALAGLTGSILAFHHELDEWLNPAPLARYCHRSNWSSG